MMRPVSAVRYTKSLSIVRPDRNSANPISKDPERRSTGRGGIGRPLLRDPQLSQHERVVPIPLAYPVEAPARPTMAAM
jgi:hypothetical protein